MQISPTAEEIELAADLLVNRYSISAQLLGRLFGTEQRDQANRILQSLGTDRLSTLDVARLLVQRKGPELFTGSREETRHLRGHLLQQVSDKKVRALFERHGPPNSNISSPSFMRRPLAEKRWHAGKHWARDFASCGKIVSVF